MSDIARNILCDLVSVGALARLVEGQLRVKPPNGGLTDAMRERIRENVTEIVAVLTCHGCEGCDRYAFPKPGIRCFWCRKVKPVEREAA